MPVLGIMGSPVIVYYCNNYIPDIPALGLVFAGFYYYYEFMQAPESNKLIKTSLFWTLAMLLKITAGILPLAAMAVLFIEALRKKKLVFYIKQSLPFVAGLVLVAWWYSYANATNEKNQSHNFLLTGLMPIWDVTKEVLPLKTEAIFDWSIKQLFPNFINVFFVILYFFLLFSYKRVNRTLLNITSFCLIGTITYFMFWYNQFEAHDYYFINFIPFYVCLFLLFV